MVTTALALLVCSVVVGGTSLDDPPQFALADAHAPDGAGWVGPQVRVLAQRVSGRHSLHQRLAAATGGLQLKLQQRMSYVRGRLTGGHGLVRSFRRTGRQV